MLTPSLNTVMTRFLIVVAVLATLALVVPAVFAQEAVKGMMTVDYDENDTDAVITFTSTDPEGSGVDWDVTGLDADDFMIDERGVLTFKRSPNYESPTDRELDDDGDPTTPVATTSGGFIAEDRMYQITVRATEQRTEGADVRALSTETDVTVMVMDVKEDGMATLNRLQPEVGTAITAMVSDPDGTGGTDGAGTPSWQWYVSKVTNPILDQNDHWIMAVGTGTTGSVTESYTPAGDRIANDPAGDRISDDLVNDAGKYLRAVATYFDRNDATSTARVMSMNPVRAEVTSDSDRVENPENGSPGFSSAGDYTRAVPENTAAGMPVGDPVTAIDPNGDTLTYELDVDLLDSGETANAEPTDGDDGDIEFFSIDMATGQLMVKKTLDYDANMNGYTIYVRATDPSGETAHVEVKVTATDTNDAPKIMGSLTAAEIALNNDADDTTNVAPRQAASELRVMEQKDGEYTGAPDMLLLGETGSGLGAMNVFTAPDEDARGQIFWSLTGEDADDFDLSQSSDTPNPTGPTGLSGPDEPIALRFKSAPDFEAPTDSNKDSVYKVTLVATDSRGATDMRPVTVFVDNVEEEGKATLSDPQPLTGTSITAMIEDPDNGVAIVTWQWLRATSTANTFMVIPGATKATYTPKTADNGYYLQAKATYTDITSNSDDSETKTIDERTQKEDSPGNATEDPAARTADPGDGSGTSDKLYRVMVTSANAVRVGPTDPTEVGAPQFAMSSYDRKVVENAEVGTIVGDPVKVNPELDKDGNPITTFEYDLLATITGSDDYFMIDDHGQIRVKEVGFPDPIPAMFDPNCDDDAGTIDVPACPAMDDPVLDYEGMNTFTLIVTATDMDNSSRKATATVTVSLENLNERPYFDRTSREFVEDTIEYMEQRTNRVAPLAAVEPDGGSLRWEVTGADADDFMIMDADDINDGKDRVELRFKSQPDFENGKGSATSTGADARAGDTYMVTVRATEMTAIGGGPAKAGEREVTVQVTNAREPGMVDFTLLQPEVLTELTAMVSDPDIVADSPVPTWQWYRAKVTDPNRSPNPASLSGEWEMASTTVGVADAEDYTPVAADEGKHLLARVVEYTDGAGTSTVVGITANPVRADVSNDDNNSPDFNTSKTTRMIPEDTAVGMPVGEPVDVDRNEDSDVLTYEIVTVDVKGGTLATAIIPGNPGNDSVVEGDLPFFSIDKATGQLRVKKMLSAEMTDGRWYNATTTTPGETEMAAAGKYTVVVRATDPSGEPDNENRDDIVVTITATDINEAPTVMGMAELAVNEANSSDDDSYFGLEYKLNPDDSSEYLQIGDTFATTTDTASTTTDNLYHRSEEDVVDRAIWPEPIAGPDGALFEYSTPDSGIGRRLHFISSPDFESPMDANRDNVYEVDVKVTDTAGAMGMRRVRITVMNVDEMGKLTLSPDQPDDGMPVKAMLTDPDGIVSVTDWKWYATSSRDRTDVMATGGASTSEYTGMVGDFLWAMVSYRDGASMENDYVTVLDERNDGPGTPDDTEHHKFEIEGASPADTLFHNSDNMLEEGTANAVRKDPTPPADPDAPATGVQMLERMVYENVPSTGYVGDPIEKLGDRDEIGGPDGATFVFAEDEDDLGSTYYDDVLATTTDDETDKAGQLALKSVNHLDYESKDTYIIEVSDPDAERELSIYRVTIVVMDVNERPTVPSELRGLPPVLNTAPMFAATSTTRMVDENTAADMDIGDPVMATDADRGDTLTYELGGADAASFAIDAETGQLMTSAALDYETKMEYMVTVTATDSDGETAMIYVTINVTNVGLDNMYDMNEDDTISRDEVIAAIRDYLFNDALDKDGVIAVIRLYLGLGS